MYFKPEKSIVWVSNETTQDLVQDYTFFPIKHLVVFYIIYLVLWLLAVHFVGMFHGVVSYMAYIWPFLFGLFTIFLLDYINYMTWEISILDKDRNYYITNTDISHTDGDIRVMTHNKVFKIPKGNHHLLLIDGKKYEKYIKEKKIKDIGFEKWNFARKHDDNKSRLEALNNTTNKIAQTIQILMDCSYYLFTILITLSAVAHRLKKNLIYKVIPWVLISAIIGLGSNFLMFWEKTYVELLNHLNVKKKILITSISFAIAACFTFGNNI